ncbi:MAG: hypothetical protein ACOYM3_21580 [Terrimicrobiaceae bacterium]
MPIEPSTASQGITLVVSGAVAFKIIELVFSLAKTWIDKRTPQRIEQPVEVRTSETVHVQRPADGIYVTEQNCELRRVCLRQEFSGETKRIYNLIGQTQGMVIDVLRETARGASSESIAAALVKVAEAVKEKK